MSEFNAAVVADILDPVHERLRQTLDARVDELRCDLSTFNFVDGEEGDWGDVRYYAKDVLIAVLHAYGGDRCETELTDAGRAWVNHILAGELQEPDLLSKLSQVAVLAHLAGPAAVLASLPRDIWAHLPPIDTEVADHGALLSWVDRVFALGLLRPASPLWEVLACLLPGRRDQVAALQQACATLP